MLSGCSLIFKVMDAQPGDNDGAVNGQHQRVKCKGSVLPDHRSSIFSSSEQGRGMAFTPCWLGGWVCRVRGYPGQVLGAWPSTSRPPKGRHRVENTGSAEAPRAKLTARPMDGGPETKARLETGPV